MREYFVPENSVQKQEVKMREYFVPENIGQKKATKNA